MSSTHYVRCFFNQASAQATAGILLTALTALAPAYAQQEPPAPAAAETIPVAEIKPKKETTAAQEPAADDSVHLDTIEVTANRRIKSQRDIAGSVNAIRGEALEKMSAQSMKDYLKLVPGVSLNEFGNVIDSNVPVIRGIATSSTPGVTQTPVGIFVDDVPFTDLGPPVSVPDVNPFDVERVEVLKGPQGTLFGVGALAGAIHYILNKPNHAVWEGKLFGTLMQSKFSDDLSSVAAGALNIPLLGDALAFRLVGLVRRKAGIVDDLALQAKDVDQVKQSAGRILGSWHASDRLNLTGAYFLQYSALDDSGFSNTQNFERSGNPYPTYSNSNFSGLNLSAAYEFDASKLLLSSNRIRKSIRRLIHNEQALSTGVDDPRDDNANGNGDIGLEDQNVQQYLISNDAAVRGYLHELRWSSPEGAASAWDWLAGAAYLTYDMQYSNYTPIVDTNGSNADRDPPVSPTGPVPTPIGPITGTRDLSLLDALQNIDTSEVAVFGEGTYRIGDHWEAIAGARAYQTRVDARAVFASATNVLAYGTTEKRQQIKTQERGINPRFSLRYKHSRNAQIYLLASKGFQIGGAQLAPPNVALSTTAEQNGFRFTPYKSSVLWNYEAGLRTEWLDRRLRLDAALFYLDWTDLQLSQTNYVVPQTRDAVPQAAVGFPLVANLAAAHSAGAELALELVPFAGATITSTAAWTSALTDVPYYDGIRTLPAGTRLPGSPRFQWANSFNYTQALPYFSNWQGGLTLIHAHTGESFIALDQVSTPDTAGGYDTLDARLSLVKSDSQFQPTLNLGMNNITDVRGVGFGAEGTRQNFFYFINPRTAVLSLSMRY